MKNVLIQLMLFSGFGASIQAAPVIAVPDSVGVIRFNGKSYILHKVDKGQTMYALTRRYGTTIAAIKDANPGLADQITENETLRIPLVSAASKVETKPAAVAKPEEKKPAPVVAPKPAAAPAAAAVTHVGQTAGGGVHKVEVGQTLYSIAAKYGVSMENIRKWNGMQSDNVILGQEIIVSEKKSDDHKPAGVVTSVNADTASAKSKPVVAEKVVKPVDPAEEPKAADIVTKTESGLAEIIDVNESTSTKYLALHRTAPIGTLIEVKNEFNQETLLVKVIGRIPDTAVNQDIVIKLSGRAFEKIAPNSRRFRASISYKSAK